MEVLGSELVSSDSDDADYVPPPSPPSRQRNEPRLRARAPALAPPSDEDEDDDDEDDEEDELFSEDALLNERRALAAPSSAAGSSAAHAAAAAAAAGAGAASSSAGAGAAASSAGAGAAPSSAGAAAASLTAGAAVSSSSAGAALASTSASAVDSGCEPRAVTAAAADSSPAGPSLQCARTAGLAPSRAQASVVEKRASVGASAVRNAVAGVEQPAPKRARVSPPNNKSIDDIWAEMNNNNRPLSQPQQQPVEQSTAARDDGGDGDGVKNPAEKATTPFKVRMLHDLEKEQNELNRPHTSADTKAPATGLEAVLGLVRGKKAYTVLDGTRKQWSEFKKDEQVNEELETYKKGRQRYTDRMAFLARSDVREWEFEQRGKRKRR